MDQSYKLIVFFVILSWLIVPAGEDNENWSHHISVKILLMVSFDLLCYVSTV